MTFFSRYDRVPHICPQLADVGFRHLPRMGAELRVPHICQQLADVGSHHLPRMGAEDRVPHICLQLADVGSREPEEALP
jgi:hypothetical protein